MDEDPGIPMHMKKTSRLHYAYGFLLCLATGASALSSGPGMPEYNDFESVQNTDLVNLATGEFSYSIPVLTVPGPGLGFPIVLNYHAGIQPEQEASWVGLGWNLQAGAITRRVNNVPDEFQGDLISEELTSKHIHGWLASIGWNGYTVGLSWDSENGMGGMVGLSMGPRTAGPVSVGIGVTGGVNGVYQGVGVSASIGISGGTKDMGDAKASAGLSIGWHSERGVSAGLGGGISLTQNMGSDAQPMMTSASMASVGVSLSSRGVNAGATAGVGMSMQSTLKGNVYNTSMSAWIPFWTPWTGYMELNFGSWDVYIDGFQEDHYYGFLHLNDADMQCTPGSEGCYWSGVTDKYTPCTGCDQITRVKKMDYNNPGEYLDVPGGTEPIKLGYTGEDIYSVQTEGLSGTFKPYRTDDGDYYTYLSNQRFSYQEQCDGALGTGYVGKWFGGTCTRHTDVDYGHFFEGGVTMDAAAKVVSGGAFTIPSRNHHNQNNSMAWRFDSEMGGALFTDPDKRDDPAKVSGASTRIEPQYIGGQIGGWIITNASGVRYVYSVPVINYAEQTLASAKSDLVLRTRRETPGYPYAWLLTAILSTDYVKMNAKPCTQISDEGCLPQQGDLGGWVRFNYNDSRTITWRTPLGYTSAASSYALNKFPGSNNIPTFVTSYSASMGIKSVRYLSSIETPTHIARMDLAEQERKDGDPPAIPEVGTPVNADPDIGERVVVGSEECPDHSLTMNYYDYSLEVLQPVIGAKVKLVINSNIMTKYFRDNSRARPATPSKWECGISGSVKLLSYTLTANSAGKVILTVPHVGQINTVRMIYDNGTTVAPAAAARLSYLKGITLYNKVFGNKEVSSIRFKYDYSLAQQSPNSSSKLFEDGGNQGRLTLRSLQIGATSIGPWNPPYLFTYGAGNPIYEPDKKDYWGYYCATCSHMSRTPDITSDAWNLTKITSPSGGEISMEYEPKTIEYSENTPIAFDGDQVGGQFEISHESMSVPTLPQDDGNGGWSINIGSIPLIEAASDPTKMAEEVAEYFKGKYVLFLGKVDLSKTESKADLSTISLGNAPAGAKVLIESPRLEADLAGVSDHRDGCYVYNYSRKFVYGLANTDPGDYYPNSPHSSFESFPTELKSTRISSCGAVACHYYAGEVIDRADLKTKFFDNHYQLVGTADNDPSRDPEASCGGPDDFPNYPSGSKVQWARVWAVWNKSTGTKPVFYGGGVRVKKLSFREPFSNKTNVVGYSYSEAATPTLPQSQSNYNLDIHYREALGVKPYLGSPSVLNGKVVATFNFSNAQPYSTEYDFATSKDVPVRLALENVPATTANNLRGRIRILDRSGFWGSLWRKVDSSSTHKAVRVYTAQWANRLNLGLKSDLQVSGLDLDVSKNGTPILKAEDPLTQTFSASPDPKKTLEEAYFGVSQKLWSSRFITKFCDDASIQTKNTCMLNSKGAISAQVEVVRMLPIKRREITTQDGLSDTSESNLFDYKTGVPLLAIKRNTTGEGAKVFNTGLTSLAYHHYKDMEDSNMLTQEFSTTTFQFEGDPNGKDFSDLSTDDLTKAGSSHFTLWENKGRLFTKSKLYRKSESFILRDNTGFTLPSKSTSGSKWISSGRSKVYDDFGHVTETENAAMGQRSAEVFSYGHSLPSAFVNQSHVNEVFYQSFETNEFSPIDGEINSNYSMVGLRSKTGNKSLRVSNCLEKTAAGYVVKSGCVDYGSTVWVGSDGPRDPVIPTAGCSVTADYSPVFDTPEHCFEHFIKVCGPFLTFTCTEKTNPVEDSRNKTSVCFDLPDLPKNQTYVASAWYYDQFKGSNPDNPSDNAYLDKTTQVTRPGLSLGVKGADQNCVVDDFPNGGVKTGDGTVIPAASGTAWNASQRALGDSKWRRLWLEWTPKASCAATNTITHASLCLHAGKNKSGSDVYFDEVRVRPKSALMTTYTYDHRGNMTSTADANEVTKHFQYDAFGNLSGVKNDDGVLLTEQAKKYGDRDPGFSLKTSGEVIEGCEVFDIFSSVPGYDTHFDFVSIESPATYTEKKNTLNKYVTTVCRDPTKSAKISLLMRATGKVSTFTVGSDVTPVVISTVKQHVYNTAFPTDFNAAGGLDLYHLKGPGNSHEEPIYGGGFFAFHLPDENQLKAKGLIPAQAKLKSYLIKMEISDLRQWREPTIWYDQKADFPDGTNKPENLKYRMHFRYNYFAEDLEGSLRLGSGLTGSFIRADNGRVQWAEYSGAVLPGNCMGGDDGGGEGRCFDLIEYGDVKCIEDGQTTESNCNPAGTGGYPKRGGAFSIRKFINWPVAKALKPLVATVGAEATPLKSVVDGNRWYQGDFSSLNGKTNTFVFSLFRNFRDINGGIEHEMYGWHPQTLTNWDATQRDQIKIKISIFPVTEAQP
jgi:hypothetical protein